MLTGLPGSGVVINELNLNLNRRILARVKE